MNKPMRKTITISQEDVLGDIKEFKEKKRQELEKKVCEMYQNSKIRLREIINKLNLNENAIYKILQKNNIKLRGHPKIDKEKEKAIIKKYRKSLKKKYTDEELKLYSKPLRKLNNQEEIIKKWGKKKCKV